MRDEITKPRRCRGKSIASLRLIDACHEILEEIQPASVRAVCYRLFTMRLIPNMGKSATNSVSKQLVYARENGIIPWDWVVDETRSAERVTAWDDPEHYARAVQRSYRRDRWTTQPRLVEVWSEKGTIRGTLEPVLDRYAVTLRVMHGYSSATSVNEIADQSSQFDEPLLALYVGDWDPSGLHMSEVDLPDRLEKYGAYVDLKRIALTHFHVENLGLPSFDADTKKKDPRHKWFVENYGRTCWELDALSPVILRQTVEYFIRKEIDFECWDNCEAIERIERESLVEVMGKWKNALKGGANGLR